MAEEAKVNKWYWFGGVAAIAVLSQLIGAFLHQSQGATAGITVQVAGTVIAQIWLMGGLFAYAQPRWLIWLALYYGSLIVGGGLAAGAAQFEQTLWLALVLMMVAIGGSVWAVWRAYRDATHVRGWAVWVASLFGAMALTAGCIQLGFDDLAVAVGGIATLGLGFWLGLRVLNYLLGFSHPVLAVAHAALQEAVRMKVVLLLIVLVLGLLPALPIVLSGEKLMQYRLQFFLTWALSGLSLLLSLLTIFIACSSICNDMEKRLVYTTLVKPLGRGHYIAGKWLGVTALNLLLLLNGGGAIYVFAKVMERSPGQEDRDRAIVEEQVLTARDARLPRHPDPEQFEQLVERERQLVLAELPGEPTELSFHDERKIRTNLDRQWHTVEPEGLETFLFERLGRARAGEHFQLRLKPRTVTSEDADVARMEFLFNGAPWRDEGGTPRVIELAANKYHVLSLPSSAVDDEGNLMLGVRNMKKRTADNIATDGISFDPGKGLEVLYPVGSFEGNLTRALGMILIKLMFLAALALAAGTSLSLNVAMLLTMLVLFAGNAKGFLEYSTAGYTVYDYASYSAWDSIVARWEQFVHELKDVEFRGALNVIIGMVGEFALLLTPPLEKLDPVSKVSTGRDVSPALIGEALLKLGLFGTIGVGLAAWGLLTRRELARVTV